MKRILLKDMGILKSLKQRLANYRELDEALHAVAFDEFRSGYRRKALWAKAIIEGQGDEGRVDSAYLRLLVEAISRETVALASSKPEPGLSPAERQDLERSAPQWYYTLDGPQHGPVHLQEINRLIRLGKLRGDDQVFGPGFLTFRKVKDFRST